MTTDLADFVDGTPGRFVPEEMQGELVEAEHLARYRWAAALAKGRRVLDAGCGLAYGARMLAAAGAASVAAVDVAEEIVEVACSQAGDAVACSVGDVRDLPFPDGAFDLVVCFEVIEHIDDQERALDEMRRVLAPGGLVAVSSPNRAVYVPGNPHHVRELLPEELERLLMDRWRHVRMVRQHNFMASALLDDGAAERSGGEPVERAAVHKLQAKRPGEELYSIALAGDAEPPDAPPLVMLSDSVEVREWLERFEAQQDILRRQQDALVEAERAAADRRDMLARLAEAETGAASLRVRAEEAEAAQAELAWELVQVRQRADRVVRAMQGSLSWRITRPLRAAKRLLAERRPHA